MGLDTAADATISRDAQEPGASGPASPAIAVENLTKVYGSRSAIDSVTFSVAAGETLALLGPNGAGKTTTVEILEGLRKPDGGRARVLGLNPWTQGSILKQRIGAMLQEGGVYPSMTPGQALRLFASYYSGSEDPHELIATVGLSDAQSTQYRRLSGGQKQRLSLALALVGKPDVVFLDEPTAGLDPEARHSTWDVICGMKARGITILLTTHYLEEAERLADRIAILNRGRLVAVDSPAALTRGRHDVVKVRAAEGLKDVQLQALPSAYHVEQELPGTWRFRTGDPASLFVEITTLCRDQGIELHEIRLGDGSLEEVFLRLTAGATGE